MLLGEACSRPADQLENAGGKLVGQTVKEARFLMLEPHWHTAARPCSAERAESIQQNCYVISDVP